MGDTKGKSGGYSSAQSPPGKIFLGLGVSLFLINHLSVLMGNGLIPEAMIMGGWTGLMGMWVLFGPRSFDAIWGWAKPSARREIGLGADYDRYGVWASRGDCLDRLRPAFVGLNGRLHVGCAPIVAFDFATIGASIATDPDLVTGVGRRSFVTVTTRVFVGTRTRLVCGHNAGPLSFP